MGPKTETSEAFRASFRPTESLARALVGETIRVGTENQAKLGAVREAFASFAILAATEAAIEVVPVAVASGVPEQPIGWEQILSGARTRARAALASGEGSIGVGIEDGLVRLAEGTNDGALRDYYNVGCAWVTDGAREGHGFSSGFAYPPNCVELAVRGPAPIGDLFDDYWSRHRPQPAGDPVATGVPSGRQGGNIGRLTGGRLDRADYGAQAVICALVPFLHADLYD